MTLNITPANLKVAIGAAVSKWRHEPRTKPKAKSERYFHEKFSKRMPSESEFKSWLGLWMIARNSPRKSRSRLLNVLWMDGRRLKNFRAGDTAGYKCVDRIADHLLKGHLANGRPLSLVSKFAFALNPHVFIPFDSRVREALHRLGYPKLKPPYSYEIYMQSVNHERDHFLTLLADRSISRHMDRLMKEFHCAKSERKLLEMRVLDKALMLVGGFKPKIMTDEVNRARNAPQR